MARYKIIQVLIAFAVSAAVLTSCAEKKKSKKTTEPGPGEQITYSASLVFPVSSSTSLALTEDEVSTVEVTTFDKDGIEIDNYSAPVKTDSEGISSVDLKVNPLEITIVEGGNLGVVIQATGEKPSGDIQRPFTPSGKNVIDAIKAIPADRRPFVDPEIIATILPPETKFDPATMKDMVLAFAEKAREIPQEKREELFLKRLEQKTDYKEMAKSRANFDNAQTAEATVARKAFIERNPELAQKPAIRFLEKPSELIEKDQSFGSKIPEAIREKVSGEALARQILARQVSSANRALKTDELVEVTGALADVKAAVVVARRGEGVGSKERMISVIETISKRMESSEKPTDIKSDAFIAVMSKVPELATSFTTKRAEFADRMCTQVVTTLINNTTKGCRDVKDGCEASDLRKNGWRDPSPEELSACRLNATTDGCGVAFPTPTKMFRPKTGECLVASNLCMAEKLSGLGWRTREEADRCGNQSTLPPICISIERSVLKDPVSGHCQLIANSCEQEDLESKGWESLNPEEIGNCQESGSSPSSSGAGSSPEESTCDVVNVAMTNTETSQCVMARDRCVERDLELKGFKRSLTLTSCPVSIPVDPAITCVQKITTMFNPGSRDCREAKNSCEKLGMEKNNWREKTADDTCALILDPLDFSERCGISLESSLNPTTALFNQSLTSLPIQLNGTQNGISYRIDLNGTLNISTQIGMSSTNNQVNLVSSSADTSNLGPMSQVIGLLAPSVLNSQAQTLATNLSWTVNDVATSNNEFRSILRANKQFQNMLCGSRIIKQQNIVQGNVIKSAMFVPGLLSSLNPNTPIAQLRKEIGQTREIDVAAQIPVPNAVPESFVGKNIIREIPPDFSCQGEIRRASIAYEIENKFVVKNTTMAGTDRLGLFKKQKVYIDSDKKKIIAVITQRDGVNPATMQNYPEICYISNEEQTNGRAN